MLKKSRSLLSDFILNVCNVEMFDMALYNVNDIGILVSVMDYF